MGQYYLLMTISLASLTVFQGFPPPHLYEVNLVKMVKVAATTAAKVRHVRVKHARGTIGRLLNHPTICSRRKSDPILFCK